MEDKDKNLFHLDELSDYKVADGYNDVRGWDVIDADARRIGKVDGMMVSKSAERVVYLDVEVDEDLIQEGHKTYEKSAGDGVHEFLNEDGENHLIIPIGMVTLDEDDEKVHSNKINYTTFSNTKRYKKGQDIDRSYELVILPHYISDYEAKEETEFYDRTEFRRR